MAQALHIRQIGEEVARLLRAVHVDVTPVSLKKVFFGTMEYYPAPPADWIRANLPIVFVVPLESTWTKPVLGPNGTWRQLCRYRILHYILLGSSEDIWTSKVLQAEKLVETLFTNWNLSSLSLTNGQILDTRVTRVGFRPPEDDVAAEFSNQLTANEILYEAEVVGTRNA